jgi:hypothetical protein
MKNHSALLCPTTFSEEKMKKKTWEEALKSFEYFQDPLFHFYQKNQGKFKKLLIEGPPNEMRWDVWKVLFEFQGLDIPLDPIDSEFLTLIEKDLERTFPSHPFFAKSENLSSLREVLMNIVRLNPELGYCQGMNSVAGVFLIISSNNVLESSLMMDIFINKFEGKGLFEPGFPKVTELTEDFSKLFKSKIPSLFNHFQNIELDQQLWVSKWFMTLFSYSFRFEDVQRFWDVIFALGLKSMVHLALSVLQRFKNEFEKRDLFNVLEFLPTLRDLHVSVEEIVRNSCRAQSTIVSPVESLWKDTDPEEADMKIRIFWDQGEERSSSKNPEIEFRKRANSLIIQHSPRHTS